METYHPGQVVSAEGLRVEVLAPLTQGALAHSYRARDLDSGAQVLFKIYSDPVPDATYCPWFPKYRSHQQEIAKRLDGIPGQAIQTIGDFVHNGAYHQVIEWANGRALNDIFENELRHEESVEKSLLIAKVMMFTLRKVHDAGIIHCDQKMDNFFAEEDPSIAVRYRIKMADFDMSLIDGKPSPKPGGGAMAGTFGYFSPEHLLGHPPQQASDVFTVGGIMLYELLAGLHPFEAVIGHAETHDEAHAEILRALLNGRVPRMEEVAPTRASQILPEVAEMIMRCLSLRPEDRPTAQDVHEVLLGKPRPMKLVLTGGPTKLKWRISEPTVLSGRYCERFFACNAGVVSSNQGSFEPAESATEWHFIPRAHTTNASLINGKQITEKTRLERGMKLQIGNPASGNIGFEMEVGFE